MVKMDKIHSIDTEKNRHFMADDFDSGKKYSGIVQNLQQEFLPSITSSLVNIDY